MSFQVEMTILNAVRNIYNPLVSSKSSIFTGFIILHFSIHLQSLKKKEKKKSNPSKEKLLFGEGKVTRDMRCF